MLPLMGAEWKFMFSKGERTLPNSKKTTQNIVIYGKYMIY